MDAGKVVRDQYGNMPGRGAYVHPGTECLELALRRRTLGRALRDGDADATGLAP